MAASVAVPYMWYRKTEGKKARECILMHTISFFALCMISSIAMFTAAPSAFAEAAAAGESAKDGLMYVGAALATGLSGIGGGIAVASAASAAIGAMSENEKIMGKTLIFVALAEGIALYGLIISLLILFS